MHFLTQKFRTLLMVLSLGLLGILAVPGCGDGGSTTVDNPQNPQNPVIKLLVFSDPHYFDPALGTTSPAFEAYLAGDRKLIAESDAIMRAMLAEIEAQKPQVVLIAGDLTKDGEQQSHLTMANYLRQIEASGRKVFVVPGNHDIQNDGAVSYAAGVATPVANISSAEFAAIYNDFGFSEAIARDPNSLSYVAALVPGLWLLALDSCTYDDVNRTSATGGRFIPATRVWIQEQLDLAQKQGIRVIGMMHHGVLEHFTSQSLLFSQFLVDDRDAVGSLFSNGGLGVVFTGHFHANDITRGMPVGSFKSIFDIETGSTVTYPSAYRVVDVSNDILTIATKYILAIDYDLKGAPDFQTYAHASLRVGLEELITDIITKSPYNLSQEDAAQLAPWLGDGLVAHYAGDEVIPAEVLAECQVLMSSSGFIKVLAGTMLQSIWTDLQPADNNVSIDLSTR
jgi:hypothetical protein